MALPYIQAVLLCSTAVDDADAHTQLCLNRLVWGGLHVACMVHEGAGTASGAAPSKAAEQICLTANDDIPSTAEAIRSWLGGLPAAAVVAVVSSSTPFHTLHALQQLGLLTCGVHAPGSTRYSAPDAGPLSSVALWLQSLAHLPWQLAQMQASRAPAARAVTVVGHVMKPSREKDMSQCTATPGSAHISAGPVPQPAYSGGLLALVPQQGLVFAPISLDMDLDAQLPFQVLLHKASDELEYGPDGRIRLSPRMTHLQEWLQHNKSIQVIDPFESTVKVLDRISLCRAIQDIAWNQDQVVVVDSVRVVAGVPRHCVIDSGDPQGIQEVLQASGLPPPWILKPSAACGVPDSHHMALVLRPEVLPHALAAAKIPLPAVLQTFSNHGGKIAKAYTAGSQVFHSIRSSIPDLPQGLPDAAAVSGSNHLPSSPGSWIQQGFLSFDSLKSMPTNLPDGPQGGTLRDPPLSSNLASTAGASEPAPGPLDLEQVLARAPDVLQTISDALQAVLGLSLFGFDVIAVSKEEGAEVELQVIDVNYFPSYKVPGAAVHVWSVLASRRV